MLYTEEAQLQIALEAAEEVVEADSMRFQPLLLHHLPSPQAAAAARLHAAVGERLLPWLHAGVCVCVNPLK